MAGGKLNCSAPVLLSHSPAKTVQWKIFYFIQLLNERFFYSLGRYFVYFFDLVILANAIFIGLERNDAEVLFLVLFNLEIVLKLYTYGFKKFFSRYWNM